MNHGPEKDRTREQNNTFFGLSIYRLLLLPVLLCTVHTPFYFPLWLVMLRKPSDLTLVSCYLLCLAYLTLSYSPVLPLKPFSLILTSIVTWWFIACWTSCTFKPQHHLPLFYLCSSGRCSHHFHRTEGFSHGSPLFSFWLRPRPRHSLLCLPEFPKCKKKKVLAWISLTDTNGVRRHGQGWNKSGFTWGIRGTWGRLQVRPASCECAGCIILTDIVGYSRMNESRKAVTLEVNA